MSDQNPAGSDAPKNPPSNPEEAPAQDKGVRARKVVKGPKVAGIKTSQPEDESAEQGVTLAPELADDQDQASQRLLEQIETHAPKTFPYKMEGEIARGGMGAIIRAWDEDLRRDLAMKVILETVPVPDDRKTPSADRKSSSVSAKALGRFLEEAQVTGQLEHPGIVPVHDLGVDPDGQVYFTMPLIKGRNLREVFKLAETESEDWNKTRVMGVILKVCEAMAYAHSKGVIHRDLKPDNIMVGRFGETYVMDWGLAKVVGVGGGADLRIDEKKVKDDTTGFVKSIRQEQEDSGDLGDGLRTMDGDVVGTPAYMAPEQAHGKLNEMGPHSDVYSMGAILYHLLSGHVPYAPPGSKMGALKIWEAVKERPPTPLAKVNPKLPAEIVAICEKSMARDYRDRYSEMGEMAEDVRAFLENRVVRAYKTGAVAEFKKWVSRNKAIAASILISLLAAGGALIAVALLTQKANSDLKDANLTIKQEKDLAEAAKKQAVEAQGIAEAAQKTAEDALDEAKAARDEAEAARNQAERDRVQAEKDRDAKAAALSRALGLSLISQSAATTETNPALSWLLSMEAMRGLPGELARNALYNAIAECHEEGILLGHEGGVHSIAFSPDGLTVATAGADNTVRLWNPDDSSQVSELNGHTGPVRSVVFSSDGRRMITGSDDGTARVWDVGSGQTVLTLQGHEGPVLSAAFSRNGRRLLTSGGDQTARVWDAQSGSEQQVIRKADPILYAAFSQAGDIVALRHSTSTSIWSVDSGERINILFNVKSDGVFAPDDQTYLTWPGGDAQFWNSRGDAGVEGSLLLNDKIQTAHYSLIRHDDAILSASFSADGKRVITTSRDKHAAVWRLGTSESDPTVRLADLKGHTGAVINAALSPDGRLAVTTSEDGTTRVWDIDQPELRVAFAESIIPPNRGWFHPDGKLMLDVKEKNGRPFFTVRDVDTGQEAYEIQNVRSPLTSAQFSPDGKLFATTERNQRYVRLYDAADGAPRGFLQGQDQGVLDANFDESGRRVVTTSVDGLARIWNTETGEVVREIRDGAGPLQEAVFSPDGKWVATATVANQVRVWDVETGREVKYLREKTLRPNTGGQDRPLFNSNGTLLATRSHKSMRIWDTKTWDEVAFLEGHGNEILHFEFSPDGSKLVTTSVDETARIWNARTAAFKELQGHGGFVNCATFSPDGAIVVTSCHDGEARIFDANTGSQVRSFTGHLSRVDNLRFQGDGKLLISASQDLTARIWNPQTVEWVVEPLRHPERVRWAVISDDGTRAATACNDGIVRIWDATNGAKLFELPGHEKVTERVEFSSDGTKLLSIGMSARIWDVATGKEIAPLVGIARDGLSEPVFNPDGSKLLAVSGWNRKKLEGGGIQRQGPWTTRVWDPNSMKVTATLEGFDKPAELPQWSSDGSAILVRFANEIAEFDAATGARRVTINSENGKPFASASFDPSGKFIATTYDGESGVTLWDTSSGQRAKGLDGHTGSVTATLFSPDGKQLVSMSTDRSARLWSTDSGSQAYELPHDEDVVHAEYTPDGSHLATVSANQVVRLWDPASGELLASLEGWRHVFFSPDGRFMASAPRAVGEILPDDFNGRLWPVDPVDYSATHKPRDLFEGEREEYLLEK